MLFMTTSSPYPPESQAYLRKIRSIPLLTQDQEYQLAKQWRDTQDSNALEKLIASHLKLVAKIAGGYRGYGLPLSDLIAEGNIGIMQALKNYDPERGYRFSTYALWWIKASMHDYILQSWSLVKMGTTRSQKKLFFGLRKTQQSLKQDNETEAELTEERVKQIAAELEVKEEEVWQMHQRLNFKDHSLNYSTHEEGDSEWIEWIVDERDNQEIQLAHQDEYNKRKRLFDKALDCLTQREHEVLASRRLKEPPYTLEQIAEKLSLSRERVRQIENEAFLKLQKQIKRLVSNPGWQHV
jgi:RNA polymerase sigma-32 factor